MIFDSREAEISYIWTVEIFNNSVLTVHGQLEQELHKWNPYSNILFNNILNETLPKGNFKRYF